jgi:hypothetical protein
VFCSHVERCSTLLARSICRPFSFRASQSGLAVPRVRSLAFSILANLLDRQPVNPSSHNRSRCRPSSSIAFLTGRSRTTTTTSTIRKLPRLPIIVLVVDCFSSPADRRRGRGRGERRREGVRRRGRFLAPSASGRRPFKSTSEFPDRTDTLWPYQQRASQFLPLRAQHRARSGRGPRGCRCARS